MSAVEHSVVPDEVFSPRNVYISSELQPIDLAWAQTSAVQHPKDYFIAKRSNYHDADEVALNLAGSYEPDELRQRMLADQRRTRIAVIHTLLSRSDIDISELLAGTRLSPRRELDKLGEYIGSHYNLWIAKREAGRATNRERIFPICRLVGLATSGGHESPQGRVRSVITGPYSQPHILRRSVALFYGPSRNEP